MAEEDATNEQMNTLKETSPKTLETGDNPEEKEQTQEKNKTVTSSNQKTKKKKNHPKIQVENTTGYNSKYRSVSTSNENQK